MNTYRSGWIAKHIGISRKTLESYEEKGYIHPTREEASNYRNYSAHDIETAWKIKQLVVIGYSHAEIRAMIDAGERLDIPADLSAKISQLERKMQQLGETIHHARKIETTGKLPPVPWP